jgi:hypothetical protein
LHSYCKIGAPVAGVFLGDLPGLRGTDGFGDAVPCVGAAG